MIATLLFAAASSLTMVPEEALPAPDSASAAGAAVAKVVSTEVRLVDVITSGLSLPVEITNANDGSKRLFIIEQSGRIRIYKDGALLATPFLNIRADNGGPVQAGGEEGLLGLAFHPNYAANGFFYVYYNKAPVVGPGGSTIAIARYSRSAGNADIANPAGQEILTIEHPQQTNHNGGKLAFGPDGFLYASVGDGGGGGNPFNAAQNVNDLRGKMLRIDVNTFPYVSPTGNPYLGPTNGRDEIWAIGLRNPWRFSFDRLTGDMYVADVGQGDWEEINYQPAGAAGGRNYGWSVFEGFHCYPPGTMNCTLANYTPPVIEYSHTVGVAIIGGFVYRGARVPRLYGNYVFGDNGAGGTSIFATAAAATQTSSPWPYVNLASFGGVSAFGEDEDGELYAASVNSGRIVRFARTNAARGDSGGDEKSELYWRDNAGAVSWWTMNGAAVTGGSYFAPGVDWVPRDVGDFNGDRRSDLIWRNTTTGAVSMWLLNGTAVTSTANLGVIDSSWTLVGSPDTNGDGSDDIVWQRNDGTVYVWVMNGATITAQGSPGGVPSGMQLADFGDFNSDGKMDILFRNTTTGEVTVWYMNGAARLGTGTIAGPPVATWNLLGSGDFNGDGKYDLLWRSTTGDTHVWLMNGTAVQLASSIGDPGLAWTVKALADFDGDGRTDIIWRHTDGTTYLWTMNGVMVKAYTPVLNPGGTWQVIGP